MTTPLETRIRAEIAATGPMRLDRYMDVCLGDPEHGYYAAGAPIGAAGDFTTAPEISQIFGELVGLWLVQCWIDQGAPDPFVLVELGPGRGVLMADALRAARVVPAFLAAARVRLVDASAPLRAEQERRLLGSPGLSEPPAWRARLDEIEELPLFLIANEFFDALPIRQWRRRSGVWLEQYIGAEDGRLTFHSVPSSGAEEPPHAAPDGGVLEISEPSRAVAAQIGARIARSCGAALIVDYGYSDADRTNAGWLETFQAVRRHQPVDPLQTPGDADLTAHVAFDDLARAAGPSVAAYGPIGQGVFLSRIGAPERAAALARAAPDRAEDLASGLRRLIDPDAMGALFRAMALLPRDRSTPAGFEHIEAASKPHQP